MRAFVQNTVVKIIAFILLTVLLFVLFLSALGVYFLAESEVYFDGGEELIADIYEEYTYSKYYTVEEMLNVKLNGYTGNHYERVLDPDKTNLRYTAVDDKGVSHGTNKSADDEVVNVRTSVISCFVPESDRIDTHYYVYYDYSVIGHYIDEFAGEDKRIVSTEHSDVTGSDGDKLLKIRYQTGEYREITIEYGVLKDAPVKDKLYYSLMLAEFGIGIKDSIFIYAGIALVLCIVLFVMLMFGAGRKNGVEGVYLCKFHKIPFDLYLALNIAVVCLGIQLINEITPSDWGMVIFFCTAIPLVIAMALGLIVTFAARIKADGWYKNTVIWFCLKCVFSAVKFIFKGAVFVFSKIPLFYKTLLILAGVTAAEFLFLCFGMEDYVPFWVVEKIVIGFGIIYCVLCMKELQTSAKKIAEGGTEHKVDTRRMIFDFKEHGEYLNGIGNGLALAVDKSVKSERMKAELITNVSHDIKTPLTSIINYVDLLKREGLTGENAEEYLGVLERQSARLKRLTEDLVEASKASTGNIACTLEKTDLNVLLSQVSGEYEEKLTEKELALVMESLSDELIIEADGRLLWRVFDNLMNNICKYAQPHTRVYVTAEKKDGKAEIVFRNISRDPLNIAPDELTERFVRGDRSRNTEGSGLGLSIARSLTELQGGKFDIQIDGDLFKVTVII